MTGRGRRGPGPSKAAPLTLYKAREGVRGVKDADAAVIGPICEDLARQHGAARPEDLVEVSRPATAPTHRFFEWDNDAAAEAYRLDQARYLMRSYTVVIEKSDVKQEVRGLQYVNSRGGYVPAGVVFSDVDMTTEVIERAKREAESWYHRHQTLRRFGDLVGVFEAIEASIIKPKAADDGEKAAE